MMTILPDQENFCNTMYYFQLLALKEAPKTKLIGPYILHIAHESQWRRFLGC